MASRKEIIKNTLFAQHTRLHTDFKSSFYFISDCSSVTNIYFTYSDEWKKHVNYPHK